MEKQFILVLFALVTLIPLSHSQVSNLTGPLAKNNPVIQMKSPPTRVIYSAVPPTKELTGPMAKNKQCHNSGVSRSGEVTVSLTISKLTGPKAKNYKSWKDQDSLKNLVLENRSITQEKDPAYLKK
ncbi:MAG: hypothetical protein R2824_20560 [Saprospiraceae bacterium]